jgi:hypothetical protein
MTLQTLSFIFGALLLLAGIVGGGFEIKEVKVPALEVRSRILSSAVGVIFIALAIFAITDKNDESHGKATRSTRTMSSVEWDMDRWGADYISFPLPTDNPKLCEDACSGASRCLAWTYVKPNTTRGPQPQCYLKEAVPPAKADKCCVSGTKIQ